MTTTKSGLPWIEPVSVFYGVGALLGLRIEKTVNTVGSTAMDVVIGDELSAVRETIRASFRGASEREGHENRVDGVLPGSRRQDAEFEPEAREQRRPAGAMSCRMQLCFYRGRSGNQ